MTQLTKPELAALLAALRLYQAIASDTSPIEALLQVDDVATGGGSFSSLTDDEIDELCEKLNVSSVGPMNAKRAGWAAVALHAFSETTGSDGPQETLGDLLCDLMHWADQQPEGIDFTSVYEKAAEMYEAELLEQE